MKTEKLLQTQPSPQHTQVWISKPLEIGSASKKPSGSRRLLAIFILLLASMHLAWAQNTWQQTISLPGVDFYLTDGVQTPDSGFLVTGYADLKNGKGEDAVLIKFKPDGQLEWQKFYGGLNDDGAHSILLSSDGGIVLAGYTNSFYLTNKYYYLVKTDASGNLLWTKSYGQSPNYVDEICYRVLETTDKGFLLAGIRGYSGLLIKTDSLGTLDWHQTYVDDVWGDPALLYDAAQTADGGFIFAGYKKEEVPFQGNLYLLKTDGSGNHLWRRGYYNHPNWPNGSAVLADSDGNIVAAGYGTGAFVVKVDSGGSAIWGKSYKETNYDEAKDIYETADNGYVMTGITDGVVSLTKLDRQGNVIWAKKFTSLGSGVGNAVKQTFDGGYFIIAQGSTGLMDQAGFIIKTDNAGNAFCQNPDASLSINSNVLLGVASVTQWSLSYSGSSRTSLTTLPDSNLDGLICSNVPLFINWTKTDIVCKGGSMGAIDLYVYGGTPPYTYSWSNGATTQDLNDLSAGLYRVTIQDAGGLDHTDSIWIAEAATLFETTMSVSDISCDGINNGSIDLSPVGGNLPYTFSWSNGATTEDLYDLSPGTYAVVIQDNYGCTRMDTAIIHQRTFGTAIDHAKISATAGNFTGDIENSAFSVSVDTVGDLNNDGIMDIAVGAHGDDDGGTNRGAVWILFLDNIGAVQSHQKISGATGGFSGTLDDNDFFGHGVAALGDLDGDGIGDIAVGASQDDDGGTDNGAVWILFMHSNGTVKSHQKISATQGGFSGTLDGDGFGRSLSKLPDLDGDGIVDLAVGANKDDDGGQDRGAVWILFLNTNGTVKTHQKISDTQGNFTGMLDDEDRFGWSIASPGDIDGDSVQDIAVGARQDDDGGNDIGAVWILFLQTNGTVKSHQKISATQGGLSGHFDTGDNFGFSLAGPGDLDQDGTPDLAVAAHQDDDGGFNRGAVYVLLLHNNGSVKDQQKISNLEGIFYGELNDADRLGSSLAALGDHNGDGLPDIIAGASGDDDGATNNGAIYLLNLCGRYTCTFTVDASTTADSCEQSIGKATLTLAGNTPPYQYLWNTGDSLTTSNTTYHLINKERGEYFYTVTDVNNCVVNGSVKINGDTLPVIEITGDKGLCLGESTILTASGGLNYSWNTGATTAIVSVTPAADTSMSVRVTGPTGCMSSDTVNVYVSEAHTIQTSVDTTVCLGDTIRIAVAVTDTPEYEIVTGDHFDQGIDYNFWDIVIGGQPSNNCGSVGGDALYFNGTNSRAASTRELDISPGDNLQFFLKFGNSSTPCDSPEIGDDVVLEYSIDHGTNWTVLAVYPATGYRWFTLIKEPIPAAAISGHTIFKWRQISHLGSGDNWAIDDVEIGYNTQAPAAFSYSWYPATGLNNPNIREPLAFPDTTTTYYVTVTNNVGCAVQDSLVVSVNDLSGFDMGPDRVICPDDSLLLNIGSGYSSILWSDNSTDSTFQITYPGTYHVTVTDAFGCMGSDTITASELELTILSQITPETGTQMDGAIDVLISGGQMPYTYSWSTGATTEDITNLSAGAYVLEATEDGGCTTQKTFVVLKNPQASYWQQSVGFTTGVDYIYPYDIQLTADEGYILCGTVIDGPSYGFLMKIDHLGNQEWIKQFANVEGRSIQSTPDGGYIFTGKRTNVGYATDGMLLVKTDSLGQIQWDKAIGTSAGSEDGSDVIVTADSGFAVLGSIKGIGAGDEDIYMVKADQQGNLEWTRTYGGNNREISHSLQQTSDGGFIIAGRTESFGAGHRDAYIIKTDNSGNIEWTKTIGVTGWEEALCVVETMDGGFVIGMRQNGVRLAKLNTAGDLLWMHRFTLPGTATITNLLETTAGNLVFTGTSDHDIYLVAIDSQRNILWARKWDTGDQEAGHGLCHSGDGGFAMTGFIKSSGREIYIIKTDENGNSPCNQFGLGIQKTGSYQIIGAGGTTGSGGTEISNFLSGFAPTTYNLTLCISCQVAVNAYEAGAVSCLGGNDGLAATAPAGHSPYTFTWNTGASTDQVSGLTAGTYWVEITDSNGCTGLDSVIITEPNTHVAIQSQVLQNAICKDGNEGSAFVVPSGGTPPYTLLWDNSETTDTAIMLNAGWHTVVASDNNGCSITDSVNITEPATKLVVHGSIDQHVSCVGGNDGAVTVSPVGGSPPYTYTWDNGETTATAIMLGAGIQPVNVTDDIGCTADTSFVLFDSLSHPSICMVSVEEFSGYNIIVWEKPDSPANYNISRYHIYKESTVSNQYNILGTVPAGDFSVFKDTTSNPLQSAARYRINAVDSCGTESDSLSAPHKTIHLSINQGAGGVINLNWNHYEGFDFNTYHIYRQFDTSIVLLDSVQSSLSSYTDLNPPSTTHIYYWIEVIHPTGCNPSLKRSDYTSSLSNRVEWATTSGIAGNVSTADLYLYPNPTEGSVNLDLAFQRRQAVKITVFDVWGAQIASNIYPDHLRGRFRLDLSIYPAGIYYLQIASNDIMAVRKIILCH